MLKSFLAEESTLTEEDFEMLGEKTAGFSGSDISLIINDALMETLRKMERNQGLTSLVQHASIEKPSLKDFFVALSHIKGTINVAELALYEEWTQKFGS